MHTKPRMKTKEAKKGNLGKGKKREREKRERGKKRKRMKNGEREREIGQTRDTNEQRDKQTDRRTEPTDTRGRRGIDISGSPNENK